ncbi:hypothetical protein KI809_19180 [Geobacter pelophilus]|uniref:DUF402 domain-containing protein n=1 Tax=Geoanaerobacter pelophilus TaxID=60036 RepID=A0AAW4L8G0_9BACT|nr:hypothetical protein [Geoanaerobacter pelophilus]MBT0666437.1 hypothetical protein [Geoanaerobacter pelophilus]
MWGCKPLNLELIRTNLRYGEVSLKKMGELIPVYVPGCKYSPVVPETRIWAWEQGTSRSIPEYVYFAYGSILICDWSSDRHEIDMCHHREMDAFYGGLLNPSYGQVLALIHDVRQRGDPGDQQLLDQLESIKQGWEQNFQNTAGLDFGPVWVEKIEDLFS